MINTGEFLRPLTRPEFEAQYNGLSPASQFTAPCRMEGVVIEANKQLFDSAGGQEELHRAQNTLETAGFLQDLTTNNDTYDTGLRNAMRVLADRIAEAGGIPRSVDRLSLWGDYLAWLPLKQLAGIPPDTEITTYKLHGIVPQWLQNNPSIVSAYKKSIGTNRAITQYMRHLASGAGDVTFNPENFQEYQDRIGQAGWDEAFQLALQYDPGFLETKHTPSFRVTADLLKMAGYPDEIQELPPTENPLRLFPRDPIPDDLAQKIIDLEMDRDNRESEYEDPRELPLFRGLTAEYQLLGLQKTLEQIVHLYQNETSQGMQAMYDPAFVAALALKNTDLVKGLLRKAMVLPVEGEGVTIDSWEYIPIPKSESGVPNDLIEILTTIRQGDYFWSI